MVAADVYVILAYISALVAGKGEVGTVVVPEDVLPVLVLFCKEGVPLEIVHL